MSREFIIRTKGYRKISALLWTSDETLVLSALTTLMYLITPESKDEIITSPVVQQIQELTNSTNKRIKNLADVFSQDFCGRTCDKSMVHSNEVSSATASSIQSVQKATNESKSLVNIKLVKKPSRIVITEESKEIETDNPEVRVLHHPRRRL